MELDGLAPTIPDATPGGSDARRNLTSCRTSTTSRLDETAAPEQFARAEVGYDRGFGICGGGFR
jgi:hypothetical protein